MADQFDLDEDFDLLEPEDVPGIKTSLRFYQVLAWVVGVLLVLLTCVAMPLKYIWDDGRMVMVVGIAHGWLYAILLVAVFALGLKVKWSWKWFVGIALAGTIPFLSFVAERKATKFVDGRVNEVLARG